MTNVYNQTNAIQPQNLMQFLDMDALVSIFENDPFGKAPALLPHQQVHKISNHLLDENKTSYSNPTIRL